MQRCVFVQRSVSSRSIIVARVTAQYATKMHLAKDNDVQAFAANGPNQPFGIPVLPWRMRRNRFVPNHCTEAPPYDRAESPISVTDQIGWRAVPRERFDDLTRNPVRRWAFRHGASSEVFERNSPRSIDLIRLSRSRIEHSSPDSDPHAKQTGFATATGSWQVRSRTSLRAAGCQSAGQGSSPCAPTNEIKRLGMTLQAQNASKRPNIVFFLADDLGYADVSCYGRPDLSTPNIDRIAANGIRFLQAYANSAVCSATRTALITGRYQYRLRLGLEEPLAGNPGVGLPPDHPTLPSLLKKVGYQTALVGKWHMGVLPHFGPLQSGYDHFYGFRGGAIDYYAHTGTNQKDDFWDGDVAVHEHGYATELLGARAVDTVNAFAKSGEPFLLSLHFNAPHWPWEAPGDEAGIGTCSPLELA